MRYEFRFALWFVGWLSAVSLCDSPGIAGLRVFTAFILAVLSASWLRLSVYREWRFDRTCEEIRFNKLYAKRKRKRGDGEL